MSNAAIIPSKPLRYLGLALFLGGIAFALIYSLYVRNSGDVVATAQVQSKVPHGADERIERFMGPDYQYHDLTFTPLRLSPDMGDLKVTLVVNWGKIFPSSKTIAGSRYYELKNPDFQLAHQTSGQIVLQKNDWRTTTSSSTYSTSFGNFSSQTVDKNYNSEGRINKDTFYVLGHATVSETADYVMTAKNIILVEKPILPDPKDFSIEVRSGAIDFNVKYGLCALGAVLLGALLLYLTNPLGAQAVKFKRKR